MIVEQLSVFLENKAGRLMEVTKALTEARINIRALSLADTSDFGILRLIVDDIEKAQSVLKEKGFTVGKTGVIAVEAGDHPGGLQAILQVFETAGVNVEYMYAFVQKNSENATLIFRLDRIEYALEELKKNNIAVLPVSKVCGSN